MLVCYLDDSGKDKQNPITTIAGYAATDDQWAAFETEAEKVFDMHEVKILHTKDLHHTDGEFEGWSRQKKREFISEIGVVLSHHIPLGVSMSVAKGQYKTRAVESGRKRTVTPYTFCSNVILDWLLTDIRVGRIANTEGLAIILETGNEHNAEAEKNFYDVQRIHGLGDVLRSISFVPKEHCRAIQMADMFAFYSRRHGVKMVQAKPSDLPEIQASPGEMLNILTACVPHRAFVATDFGPKAGSRFLSGDVE